MVRYTGQTRGIDVTYNNDTAIIHARICSTELSHTLDYVAPGLLRDQKALSPGTRLS